MDVGKLGPVNVCCGAYPGHRDYCTDRAPESTTGRMPVMTRKIGELLDAALEACRPHLGVTDGQIETAADGTRRIRLYGALQDPLRGRPQAKPDVRRAYYETAEKVVAALDAAGIEFEPEIMIGGENRMPTGNMALHLLVPRAAA